MNWGRLSKIAANILNFCNFVFLALISFAYLRIPFLYNSMPSFMSSVWTSFLSWLISFWNLEISFWSLATSLSIFWWVKIWNPGRWVQKIWKQFSLSSCCSLLLKKTRNAAVAGAKGSTKVAVPKAGWFPLKSKQGEIYRALHLRQCCVYSVRYVYFKTEMSLILEEPHTDVTKYC